LKTQNLRRRKEDFNKFVKALDEAVDYVKTDLMPDFDFDAFNHDQPAEGEGRTDVSDVASSESVAAPSPVSSISSNGTTANNSEEVDNW
jgi:hypothetical protein